MSDARPVQARTSLRVERLLPAPVDQVFAAWTDPQMMARWLAPSGRAEAEADVRVGGGFRVVMIGDGMRIEHTGEYVVVDPPRRLCFTWISSYTGSEPSLVDVALTPRGATTWLVLSHQRLPRASVASHEGGWGAILERLAAVLGARDNAEKPA